jgi:hypothetical protein
MLAMTVALLALSSILQAEVRMKVYRCDEKTPLVPIDPNHPGVYGDIMVGTKLTVVVCSDSNKEFSGFLEFLTDGVTSLAGRGYDPMLMTYVDSPLPASGEDSYVMPLPNEGVMWLSFGTGVSPSPGAWFVFDYCAERVGSCDLGLYDANGDWGVPVELLSFSHVPSCDFDGNGSVSFKDFALFASHDLPASGFFSNTQDGMFDLDSNHTLDFRDLAQFSEHWLERTTWDGPAEPNQPVTP